MAAPAPASGGQDWLVDNDRFESEHRARERYSQLRLEPGAWPVVRVDGRSFLAFTRDRYDKPFDPALSDAMQTTAARLVEELGGVLAYTESDEISVLLPLDCPDDAPPPRPRR